MPWNSLPAAGLIPYDLSTMPDEWSYNLVEMMQSGFGSYFNGRMSLYDFMHGSPGNRVEPFSNDPTPMDDINFDQAVEHYKNGKGKPISIPFDKVDTSQVTCETFPDLKKLIEDNKCKTVKISIARDKGYKAAYTVPGDKQLILGDITLRTWGDFESDGTSWKFTGNIAAFHDTYDFNKSTHRGVAGELLTMVGRDGMNGTAYDIQMPGTKPLTCSGTCPVAVTCPKPKDPGYFY